jgi:oxygen-independent coproporphyrinogen-3 oxidase
LIEDWRSGGFGLYVHWPYCEAKCPYCDFNSHVRREIDQSRWQRAYLLEIARYREKVPGRLINSVFFGGGTPSLMAPETVAAVIAEVRASWPVANDLEVTLEANPGSVEAQRFAAYADAGVNRVSMGVQALNDLDLRRLGRLHTAAEARRAFEVARKLFDRVSFDLIYARQDQTVADWRCDLKEALAMSVDHLSLYQLTIEPGTTFGERFSRGMLRGLPDEDRSAAMYETTQEACLQAGLPAYEISNHARPGAESRHNLIYWRYGDYVGIGPGAHGRITAGGKRFATEAWSNPERWLDTVERGAAEKEVEPLSDHDQLCEFLLMGLRLDEGVELARLRRLAGGAEPEAAITHLKSMGMLEVIEDRLRATDQGRMVLNSVLKMLLD